MNPIPSISKRTRVLVVEDDRAVRMALVENFRRDGWDVSAAAECQQARVLFLQMAPPLVVSDVRLPDGDGIELLHEFRRLAPATAVLLLTAFGTVSQAVEAIRDGACDYLQKPVPFAQLREAAAKVLAKSEGDASSLTERRIVGQSPALIRALEQARQAAAADADILLEAESGTGKELLARFIHEQSARRKHPFVAVNCAAVPENLLESELFGHVRGAFTGALSSRIGRFEAANGGTLLLDEIGEMPLELQPKILRALQEREIERLGDTRVCKIDVRVIATTNRSLRQLVDECRFRSDLFFRLNVIPLSLPPLRERPEDIPVLAEYYLQRFSKGRAAKFGDEFLAGLQSHAWPGNVRELANLMRRVAALCTTEIIGPEFLESIAPARTGGTLSPGVSLRDAERRLLEVTLLATAGNRTRAAEMMGVSLRTIRNKIRDYGLPPRRYA